MVWLPISLPSRRMWRIASSRPGTSWPISKKVAVDVLLRAGPRGRPRCRSWARRRRSARRPCGRAARCGASPRAPRAADRAHRSQPEHAAAVLREALLGSGPQPAGSLEHPPAVAVRRQAGARRAECQDELVRASPASPVRPASSSRLLPAALTSSRPDPAVGVVGAAEADPAFPAGAGRLERQAQVAGAGPPHRRAGGRAGPGGPARRPELEDQRAAGLGELGRGPRAGLPAEPRLPHRRSGRDPQRSGGQGGDAQDLADTRYRGFPGDRFDHRVHTRPA